MFALALHPQLHLLALLVGAQDASGVRRTPGLAAIDGENHVADFDAQFVSFWSLQDQYALVDTEILAKLGRHGREFQAQHARPAEQSPDHARHALDVHVRWHARHDLRHTKTALQATRRAAAGQHVAAWCRPRGDFEILRLAIAQHLELDLLVRLDAAHLLHQFALSVVATAQVHAPDAHDHITGLEARRSGRATGTDRDHPGAVAGIGAAALTELHAEDGAPAIVAAELENPRLGTPATHLHRQLGDIAGRGIQPLACLVQPPRGRVRTDWRTDWRGGRHGRCRCDRRDGRDGWRRSDGGSARQQH